MVVDPDRYLDARLRMYYEAHERQNAWVQAELLGEVKYDKQIGVVILDRRRDIIEWLRAGSG